MRIKFYALLLRKLKISQRRFAELLCILMSTLNKNCNSDQISQWCFTKLLCILALILNKKKAAIVIEDKPGGMYSPKP